uniref:Uncharacterized protein n=1 Tax=Romanomermis culicivorax TaxID=13658 RepID=A0A915JWI2_ROMCU
MDLFELLQSSL